MHLSADSFFICFVLFFCLLADSLFVGRLLFYLVCCLVVVCLDAHGFLIVNWLNLLLKCCYGYDEI